VSIPIILKLMQRSRLGSSSHDEVLLKCLRRQQNVRASSRGYMGNVTHDGGCSNNTSGEKWPAGAAGGVKTWHSLLSVTPTAMGSFYIVDSRD